MKLSARTASRGPRFAAPLRAGFTLTELLVVVVIVLLLAAAAVPVALAITNGRAVRDASSTLQSTLAGARDRAGAFAEPRGLRLIPDTDDPSLVTELRFIRPYKPMSVGSVAVVDVQWNAQWNSFTTPFPVGATTGPAVNTSSWPNGPPPTVAQMNNRTFSLVAMFGAGVEAVKLTTLPFRMAGTEKVYFGALRLHKSGQVLGFTTTNALLNNVTGGEAIPLLRLDIPLPRPAPFDYLQPGNLPYYPAPATTWAGAATNAGYAQLSDYFNIVGDLYDIPLGNVEAEGEVPIKLPASVVLDLGYIDPTGVAAVDPSGVRLSRLQPESGNWDILFAPNGQVLGAAASESHIFLWLRERNAATQDVTVATTIAPSGKLRMIPANNTGNHSFVAVASRSGLIRSVEANFGADPNVANATVDATLAAGIDYWNPSALYNLYFSSLLTGDGGETGL